MKAIAIRPGQLRERLRVERAVGSAWVVVDTIPMRVVPVARSAGGDETSEPVMGNAYQITTRYRTDLTNQAPGALRIKRGSETISITSAMDVDGRHRELQIAGNSYAVPQVAP